MIKQVKLPDGALEILLKEYAFLKDEIKERLKTAFSHVAYLGGIAAFIIPASDKIKDWIPTTISILLVFAAAIGLLWVAFLNMRWVQHCGVYVEQIEDRINEHFGEKVLGWERTARSVQASLWFLIPRRAKYVPRENIRSEAAAGDSSGETGVATFDRARQ